MSWSNIPKWGKIAAGISAMIACLWMVFGKISEFTDKVQDVNRIPYIVLQLDEIERRQTRDSVQRFWRQKRTDDRLHNIDSLLREFIDGQ